MATPRNRTRYSYWPSTGNTSRRYARVQNGWNGDHIEVLPYWGYEVTATGRQRGSTGSYTQIDAPNTRSLYAFEDAGGIPSWAQPAYNACYAQFREKVIGEQSQLGAAFATWKQSASMIAKRGTQLYHGARSLRRGNFYGFLKEFGLKSKPRHRSSSDRLPDTASSLWLEYSYGWKPLAQDIFNAMSEMQADIPLGRFHARKGVGHSDSGVDFWPWDPCEWTTSAYVSHQIVADVRLVNPNAFLMNQLGIDNPGVVAWEVIPFSFCVDWFFDVGSWIQSFSDFAGLSVENACTTSILRFEDTASWTDPFWAPGTSSCTGVAQIRRSSIPSPLPNMQIQANLGGSLSRAANAVSLLTQALTGLK